MSYVLDTFIENSRIMYLKSSNISFVSIVFLFDGEILFTH